MDESEQKTEQRLSKSDRTGWLKIALPALIGLVGVLVTAFVTWEVSQVPIRATQTAEAKQALIAQKTSTSTAIPGPTNPPTGTLPPAAPKVTETPTFLVIATKVPDFLDGADMLFVPEGKVEMGAQDSDLLAEEDERPPHSVRVPGFWIDKFEVTNFQYILCLKAGACTNLQEDYYLRTNAYSNHPVRYVTWQDAHDYCAWAGRRLLTEAEWERAARGDDLRVFPWGNEMPDGRQANLCDTTCTLTNNRNPTINDGYQLTAPAYSFVTGISAFGVYNMAGNIREWVQDWYSPVFYSSPAASADGTQGPRLGTKHVTKGGSFAAISSHLRISSREGYAEDAPRYDLALLGIRCGMDQGAVSTSK